MIYTIIFLILAAIAIIMALSAISSKNLVHSSIFIFLGLSFIGSIELLVYAGFHSWH